jgi:hypothetical protein
LKERFGRRDFRRRFAGNRGRGLNGFEFRGSGVIFLIQRVFRFLNGWLNVFRRSLRSRGCVGVGWGGRLRSCEGRPRERDQAEREDRQSANTCAQETCMHKGTHQTVQEM